MKLGLLLFKKGKIGQYLLKFFKLLVSGEAQQIKKTVASLGYSTAENFIKEMVQTPQKVVDKLEALGTEGRREIAKTLALLPSPDVFGGIKEINKTTRIIKDAQGKIQEKITDADIKGFEPGDTQEAYLSSSWQYWAKFEYMSGNTGNLWLMTKFSPKEYFYPAVPTRTWYLMLAAKGENGNGSGSVFWATYLHRYRKTKARQTLVKQFNK